MLSLGFAFFGFRRFYFGSRRSSFNGFVRFYFGSRFYRFGFDSVLSAFDGVFSRNAGSSSSSRQRYDGSNSSDHQVFHDFSSRDEN